MCDAFRGYFPNITNNKCDKCNNHSINCAFTLTCGTCQICKSNYTLCSGNCLENILNCSIGNTCTGSCTKCSPGFYLNNGICSAVTRIITNCQEYSSAVDCLTCKTGFELNKNNNIQTCNALNITPVFTPSVPNCFIHLGNFHSCNSCISNSGNSFFKFNLMNPYKLLQDKILDIDYIPLRTLIRTYSNFSFFSALIDKNMVCQSKTISNCLAVDSYFKCTLCAVNYYLSNGNCIRIEQAKINGCLTYEIISNSKDINGYNQVECKKCNNITYLSQGKCLKFTIIIGCIFYNSDRTNCSICDTSNGYILNNNICNRSNNYKEVPNCNSYNLQGVCTGCIDKYALITRNNTCGTIKNCSNVTSGIYLSCQKCNTGYILENINTTCTPLDSNLNCLENSNQLSSNCSVCKEGYFLNDDNSCTNKRGE